MLTALTWLVPHETAAVSALVLYIPYNHVPCHFMQSHIRKVYACLAVTCHLHFWQNGRDLLRATAVTRGGTDTEIRVSTESRPWRRKFSLRSCRDSNSRPFNHESGALTTELSPHLYICSSKIKPCFFPSSFSFFGRVSQCRSCSQNIYIYIYDLG